VDALADIATDAVKAVRLTVSCTVIVLQSCGTSGQKCEMMDRVTAAVQLYDELMSKAGIFVCISFTFV